jgi:hypothetical protein
MPICLNGAKDVRHALFTCDRAREVWCALSLEQFIEDALAYDRGGSVSLEYLIGSICNNSPVIG